MTDIRRQLMTAMNDGNLAERLQGVRGKLLDAVLNQLSYAANQISVSNSPADKQPGDDLAMLLNCVGYAAASSAMAHAMAQAKKQGKLKRKSYGTDYVENLRALRNDSTALAVVENEARQFLLPQYSYLDFDTIVDPRHRIDAECGYPLYITPTMYRYMYDRDDTASRVVDIFPDEVWAAEMEVYDDPDEEVETAFEKAYRDLDVRVQLVQALYRIHKLAGIGHFGALLVGINDGKDLADPVDGYDTPDGKRRPGSKEYQVTYLRPFDEYLSFVERYETDPASPRYGYPIFYNLVFVDMTVNSAGSSIGTRLNRRVHWTRVVHVAIGLESSPIMAKPQMQPVFNRLLDLRKIKGASAEGIWKGGFPGLAFEVDPDLIEDDPDFDKAAFKEEVRQYADGMQRYLTLIGIKANTLSVQVADPSPHARLQLEAIAAHKGIPLRIFLGSEEARVASTEDTLRWNTRLGKHVRMEVNPRVVRPVIDRFVELGALPRPKDGRYLLGWPDLNTPTDEDKANLSLKWTQALAQYVGSGLIHLIKPMDYLTTILGLSPQSATRIVAAVEKGGGWAKLLAVDPSQGTGVNGQRTSDVKAGKNGAAGKKNKRNKADRQIDGRTS